MDTATRLSHEILEDLRRLQAPGEPDLVTELIDVFLEDAPVHVARARRAVDSGAGEELSRSVHSLRSSSGSLGALRLTEICGQLEGLGDRGEMGPTLVLMGELEREFAAVCELLARERVRA